MCMRLYCCGKFCCVRLLRSTYAAEEASVGDAVRGTLSVSAACEQFAVLWNWLRQSVCGLGLCVGCRAVRRIAGSGKTQKIRINRFWIIARKLAKCTNGIFRAVKRGGIQYLGRGFQNGYNRE